MTELIRVLIADDHTIVRAGLRLLLEAEPDIQVVGEALDGREAVQLVESLHPDVVLMDITMGDMDGLEATRQIKSRWQQINVLILTMHRSDEYFFEALKTGASGYVLKGAETGELINAIRVVSRGEAYLYPSMAQKLLSNYLQRERGSSNILPTLSPREREILRLLVAGYSNKEIAANLVISISTVYTHRANLIRKIGLTNRHELIRYAKEHGLGGG